MKPTNNRYFKLCVACFGSGDKGGLRILWLDRTNGELKAGPRFGDGQVFYCAADAAGGYLYSVRATAFNQSSETEELLAWAPGGMDDVPQPLGRVPTGGRGSCYVGIVPGGGPVLLAHYGSAALSAIPRQVDGRLSEKSRATVWALTGASVHPKRQRQAHPHCFIATSLDEMRGIALYAADLGSDRIWCYRYNPSTASMKPAEPAFVAAPPGSGPRHLALHPGGDWLYALDELSNTLSVYRRDRRTGDLVYQNQVDTLPGNVAEPSFAGDLAIAPTGRFLYATNRGHDSIAGFDLADPGSPVRSFLMPSGASGPQNLALTSDGRWLLCAHLSGNRVVAFEVAEPTGLLRPVGPGIEIEAPACLSEI